MSTRSPIDEVIEKLRKDVEEMVKTFEEIERDIAKTLEELRSLSEELARLSAGASTSPTPSPSSTVKPLRELRR